MPLPTDLTTVLVACIGGRSEGPLFRSRAVWEGRRRPDAHADNRADVERLFHAALAAAPSGAIQTEQDRKREFRRLLRQTGGISEDQIAKELRPLLGVMTGVRPYDLRASVTQDMKKAGIHQLELRYLTGHSVNDILNEYTGLDPVGEIQKYFAHVAPILAAIRERAAQLDIPSTSRRR